MPGSESLVIENETLDRSAIGGQGYEKKSMLNNKSEIDDVIPLEFFLSQNYPNPFSEKTTIKYCVPYRTRVQLTVYNTEGKVIEKIVDEEKIPGTYEIEFQSVIVGEQLEVGEYYYCLEAGNYTNEKKMFLQK